VTEPDSAVSYTGNYFLITYYKYFRALGIPMRSSVWRESDSSLGVERDAVSLNRCTAQESEDFRRPVPRAQ